MTRLRPLPWLAAARRSRLRRTPPRSSSPTLPSSSSDVELSLFRPTTTHLDSAPAAAAAARMSGLSSYLPRFYRHPSSGQRPHEHHPFTARDVLSSYGADWALAVFLWFFLSWFNRVEGYKREFSLEHDIRCEARPRSPWSFA
jgi:hypothetical protein